MSRRAALILSIVLAIIIAGMGVGVLVAFRSARNAQIHLIPDGFTGWVSVAYGVEGAPPLPVENGQLLLRYGESPRRLARDVRRLMESPVEEEASDGAQVLRTFGTGAQILRDLGVTRMRVLSAPKQMHGISGFGLEVVEYVDDPHPNRPDPDAKT